MSVWATVVYALAVARLTGLIALDEISRPVRDWVVEHLPLRSGFATLEYLLTCAWCVSIWVATVVVALMWHWGGRAWLFGPALVLAISQAAGMISTLGRPAPTPADDDLAPSTRTSRSWISLGRPAPTADDEPGAVTP